MINDARIHFRVISKLNMEAIDESRSVHKDPYYQLISTLTALKDHVEEFSVVIQVIDTPDINAGGILIRSLELFLEPLTKREMEVYNLAMKGYSNRVIADRLFITVETVKSHRKKIVGKAGVRSIEEIKNRLLEANKLITE